MQIIGIIKLLFLSYSSFSTNSIMIKTDYHCFHKKTDFSNSKSYTTYILDFVYLKSLTLWFFIIQFILKIHIRLQWSIIIFKCIVYNMQHETEPSAQSFCEFYYGTIFSKTYCIEHCPLMNWLSIYFFTHIYLLYFLNGTYHKENFARNLIFKYRIWQDLLKSQSLPQFSNYC